MRKPNTAQLPLLLEDAPWPPAPAVRDGIANRNQVYDQVRDTHSETCDRIHAWLVKNGPATREAIADAFGKAVNQISGRITEMLNAGRCVETGERRPTRSGKTASVVRAQ